MTEQTDITIEWDKAGLEDILDQVAAGLVETCNQILPIAQSILVPHRETGAASDSLHVVDRWANGTTPAAFVATASGDGFFIHEGTVDTPAVPFLSQALSRTQRGITRNIAAAGKVSGLKARTRKTKLGGLGARTAAFTNLNKIFSEFATRREP